MGVQRWSQAHPGQQRGFLAGEHRAGRHWVLCRHARHAGAGELAAQEPARRCLAENCQVAQGTYYTNTYR